MHEGDISELREEASSIWQIILNKFSLAQKYTTLRLGIKSWDSRVRTVDVTVSANQPDLVWRTYLRKYPDENDLRPLLAESYARLRR